MARMNTNDTKKQPKTNPIQQNKQKTDANDITELLSIINEMYPALQTYAKDLENKQVYRHQIKFRSANVDLPKHLDRAIIAADTYSQRDLVCRRLSSQCYNMSKWFMKKEDYQQAYKWMTLSMNYLHLSMDPKKMQMDEKFDAELDEFRKEIEAAKERQEKELMAISSEPAAIQPQQEPAQEATHEEESAAQKETEKESETPTKNENSTR
jgi:hypothetical protein